MRDRNIPATGFPSKNQQMVVTLSDGRHFAVCSKGQYRTILSDARNRISMKASVDGETIGEDEVGKRLDEWAERHCRFAPMQWLLKRMSPAEAKECNDRYRFAGIERCKSSYRLH